MFGLPSVEIASPGNVHERYSLIKGQPGAVSFTRNVVAG